MAYPIKRVLLCLAVLMALLAVGFPLRAEAAPSASPVAQDRSVEPVVLTGSQLPGWSAGPEISAREPTQPINSDCTNDEGDGLSHNCSEPSRIPNNPNVGADVDRLLGYRWDGAANAFVQIPFQVDERFTRYISNLASNCIEAGPFCVGFGAYAGADAQLSYAYDRDSYKYVAGECSAELKSDEDPAPDPDPVKGLDDNDELAFLYRDAGGQAPPSAPLPHGISELRKIRVDDPSAPDSAPVYAYVGLATPGTTPPATDSYMRYTRDESADRYAETSDNYGNAPRGPVCDAEGEVLVGKENVPRRPLDTAWVLSPRYAFRYAGRWILRGVRVAPGDRTTPLDSPEAYGPPLLDQWKARAYAQAREDEVPCCGFENEQTNWGRTSVTLGELSGPVRVIRTTWGSDSGTNTVRHEILYPDLIVQQAFLRVHPIPPLGGIFSYWDHTAGVITKYYNPQNPEGVAVDGANDEEIVGTMHVDVRDDGVQVTDEDDVPVIGPTTVSVPPGGADGGCLGECANFDVNDPTHQASGALNWEQVSGPHGSMVFRTGFTEITPGNAQGLASLPYYRDDACFDDGTGIDPGPAKTNSAPSTLPCWGPTKTAADGPFRQGLIGAHGQQLLFAAETDNLALTTPVNEMSIETRMVVLPGDPGNVGQRYGLGGDLPLQATALDTPAVDPTSIAITGDTSGRIGEPARLEATLSDVAGPVANAPLHFTLQGMTYNATTDTQGKAVVANVPVSGPPGSTDLVVTYDGDGLLRSPTFARKAFTIEKGNTSISFGPSNETSGKVNHSAHIAATLTDASGPVAGATLTFDFQGTSYGATTDGSGVARKDVPVAGPAGDTRLAARYGGDDNRGPTSSSTTFTVTRDDATLSFEPTSASSARIGSQATFVAKLSDSAGPVAGAAVLFDFQGSSYEATTGGDGVASKAVTVTGPPGTTQVKARFIGDDSRSAASATTGFTVSLNDSTLSFEPASASSGQIGDEATLIAKLTDPTGPVPGASLRFDFQGSSYRATTGANGVASKVVAVEGPAGSPGVSVRFDGDASRTASSASGPFVVTKRATKISFTAKSGRNNMVIVNANLTDAGTSGPVAGRKVSIFVNGKRMATEDTDSEGRAIVRIKLAKPRGKAFRVEFSSDDTYEGTSAQGTFTRNGASGSS
jgi:hypothetical protein